MASKMQGNDAKNNDLNLTPLIDAVFLLLVFFMVTSVFVKATQLKIELPVAENYDQIDQEKKTQFVGVGRRQTRVQWPTGEFGAIVRCARE